MRFCFLGVLTFLSLEGVLSWEGERRDGVGVLAFLGEEVVVVVVVVGASPLTTAAGSVISVDAARVRRLRCDVSDDTLAVVLFTSRTGFDF